jgi:uncharacterized membrane protein YhaH (DUF805 family)
MKKHLGKIFAFRDLTNRSEYFFYGVILMLLKYLGEVVIFSLYYDRFLPVLEFLNPMLSSRMIFGQADTSFRQQAQYSHSLALWLYLLWSLPFIWAGFGLSARRALDAGKSSSLAFLFFFPFLNYILMATLCLLPSREAKGTMTEERERKKVLFLEALNLAFLTAACCVAVIQTFVFLFASYSSGLFIGIPFVHGFVITALLNRTSRRQFSESFRVVFISLLIAAGLMILLAMEGVICILMAAPIFLVLSLLGSLISHGLSSHLIHRKAGSTHIFSLFFVPLLFEPISNLAQHGDVNREATFLREVLTSIEIDAPPSVVWSHVVQFSDLPPPQEWIFKLGVAYPLRATIEGDGVGAIRRCQFSTGDFVEPITEWSEPHRLSFDVQYQPRPMKELSPYSDIHAPHLDNFIQSKRGQFLLLPLPGGRTQLEGRTWYTIKIFPRMYWEIFSDSFIHSIHSRVLEHTKREVEGDPSPNGP